MYKCLIVYINKKLDILFATKNEILLCMLRVILFIFCAVLFSFDNAYSDSGISSYLTNTTLKEVDAKSQHNYSEEKSFNRSKISSGILTPPPVSTAHFETKVNVIAHWYNDFGLDYTRAGGGGICWYDWRWNHHDAANYGFESYDPSRHPILGWYRGDDPIVLDWICYWLNEYGVNAVNLISTEGLNTAKWHSPSDRYFWLYQLFTNVPNFKRLRYVLSAGYSGASKDIARSWNNVVDFYLERPDFYLVKIGNHVYPLIFCFELERVRGAFDGYGSNAPNTLAFYKSIAKRFKLAGYDGVAILGRHANATHYKPDGTPIIRDLDQVTLEKNDIYFLRCSYNFEWTSPSVKTYKQLIDNYGFSKLDPMRRGRTVGNVMTSAVSKSPHPSKWSFVGNSPDLFHRWVVKAIQQIELYDMPRILTVYNVSEWAEGGPGLIPNVKDGFAYLEALKKALLGPSPRTFIH